MHQSKTGAKAGQYISQSTELRARTCRPKAQVTLLFTDIEGSTALWEQDEERMSQALAFHDALTRNTVESNAGTVVKKTGDGVLAVFVDAACALAAAVDLQRALHKWAVKSGAPLRVRCGLHRGIVEDREGDYFGTTVNRAARIMSAAHGGQVLLSQAVVDSVGDRLPAQASLRDLGRVRLRDLSTPECVYQAIHPQLRMDFPALRSLDSTPNNLPQQLTSFIGRTNEVAEVKRLLATTRLLTLTGSGGCGKTRLATQVAADLLESYPDGVWLVELASLSDPALVPQAVATVLGLKDEPGMSRTQTLVEHLKSRHPLLVLDNAEHLLTACTQVVDCVLRQCPKAAVLVSSREALGIGGERIYRVPSLSLPDANRSVTSDDIVQSEAGQLIIERVLDHLPQFTVTDQNALALASICYRLDGIPLAIELAAARLKSMSVQEVNERLDQRFRLLTGGSRTALPRQQTLRSLIDWSYDLLDQSEQILFCRLAVFAGGWSLEAAERVCSDEKVDAADALDLLTSLIEKSLVTAEDSNGATRYRLLETVRQYARDRLLERGGGERWRDRHLAYFLALTEEAEPKLNGAEQGNWLKRLETEHDNVRSALTWAAGADALSGMRLASACWRFWLIRGYAREGLSWLSEMLAAAPNRQPGAQRAKALINAGTMAKTLCDYSQARTLYEEGLSISRELGDRRRVAAALGNLGMIACEQGAYSTAIARHEESLAIWRELGDRIGIARDLLSLGNVAASQGEEPAASSLYEQSLAIKRDLGDQRGIAIVLNNLGIVASNYRNDYAAARSLHEEALAIRRELGDRWGIAHSLCNLGIVAYDYGDRPSSRALLAESLAIRRDLADRPGVTESLRGLADLAFASRQFRRGTRLCGHAARLEDQMGSPPTHWQRLRYERQIASARASFGNDVEFDSVWQEGYTMALDEAIEYALQEPSATGDS